MPRFRRARYLSFHCEDSRLPDLGRLLEGAVELQPVRRVFAFPAVTGRPVALSAEELGFVLALPGDRFADASGPEDALLALARNGVLVSDSDDSELAELRGREERIDREQWNLHAALYHFLTRWRGVGVGDDVVPDELGLADDEPPPPPFRAADAVDSVALPPARGAGGLFETLARRRTTRTFDAAASVRREDLASVLGAVYGCTGLAQLEHDVILKKTTPSGGSRHPTEAYPLVVRVEGLQPGLYHYGIERHALELLRPLAEAEARALAVELAAGQAWVGDAHVVVAMTSRFYRSFWKYRRNDRAYAVLQMDVGALAQTFYLVCAELGLGAFVTAAVNAVEVEEALGLDGFEEGALALCGCGVPAARDDGLHPPFRPYRPGETSP